MQVDVHTKTLRMHHLTRIHIFVSSILIKRFLFFIFFSSSEFNALLEVTLLIVRICNADFFHLSVCWLSRMKSVLFIMRGRRKWSADKSPLHQPSKTVFLCLATPHDTFFLQQPCPPLLRGKKNPRTNKIGDPKGGFQMLEQGGGKQKKTVKQCK